AMHSHLQQKMDSIAIMKSVGARSGQIVRIYAIQTLLLGLAGGLLGVSVGLAVQSFFPVLIVRYFQVQPDTVFQPAAAFQGLIAGILTTLLFTIPPLLSIRRIRPGVIFRREMAEVKPHWRQRLVHSRPALIAGAFIVLGVAALAAWLVGGSLDDAIRIGATFTGGILAALVVLGGAAWLLIRTLEAFVRSTPWKLPVALRHGIANIYRPGSQAPIILTALGTGVMFTLSVYLVQHSVLGAIAESAPPDMSNVFLLDITGEQREPVRQLLMKQHGLEREPEIISTVQAKLTSVNGTPIEKIDLGRRTRRYRANRSLTTLPAKPEDTEVLQGAWWEEGKDTPPLVSLTEDTAKTLDVKPGATLEWEAFGRTITATVSSIHRGDSQRLGSTIDFVLTPGVLDGLPTVYYGAVRVKPDAVPAMQRALYALYPTITVVNLADVMAIVQEVVDQIAVVVRFISAFAIIAGAIILTSSVAGTRFRRIREVAIFKTLGATRGRIAGIFSAEFLILGTVAGLIGSLLATGFSQVLLTSFFDASFDFAAAPTLISIGVTVLLATAAGWLASFRILSQRPLEILRGE
ncbi:MAG: ABC transporter permease, partial [Bryobacteraceae bacterium]